MDTRINVRTQGCSQSSPSTSTTMQDDETATSQQTALLSHDIPRVALHQICNYASLRDLKLYRRVSRSWNHVVLSHSKFVDTTVKFTKAWSISAVSMDQSSLTQWTSFKFRYFNFTKERYIYEYWSHVKTTVRTLKLANVIVKCQDLANLINCCSSLHSLVLQAISVVPIHERRWRPEVPEGEAVRSAEVHQVMICDHWLTGAQITEANRVFQPQEAFGPPTITTLEVRKQPTLPACVLKVLRHRCSGVLSSFKFEDCHERPNVAMTPCANYMIDQLARILEESRTTLKTFAFMRNEVGDNLLTMLGDEHQFLDGLALREFSIQIAPPLRSRNENRAVPALSAAIFRMLCRQQITGELASISIEMVMDHNFIQLLAPILEHTASLRKLNIVFHTPSDNIFLPVHNMLANLPHVEDLTIEDADMAALFHGMGQWLREHLNYEYVNNLWPTLKSLTLCHYWEEDNPVALGTVITHANLHNLTKFELRHCDQFVDHMMAQLIQNMPLLEELNIIRATRLTDAGVTGLDAATCATLSACTGHNWMLHETLAVENRWSLALLTRLKRLSFQGCQKLTDTSIRYGIFFPHLQALNLTECVNISDIGLTWIGALNPSLEVLTIHQIQQISHFALNGFIYAHRKIKKVYVSSASVKRMTIAGPISYTEHQLFRDIVDTGKPERTPAEQEKERMRTHLRRRPVLF